MSGYSNLSRQTEVMFGPCGWPSWPRQTVEKEAALLRVLGSGRWAISGDGQNIETEEEAFAQEFSRYTGAKHCIPTDHGTSALHLAFQALGIGPGDEVIVPGLTWVACATAPAMLGARPVLADINPHTLCIDALRVEPLITPRTRAVLVVHLYCSIAPLEELAALCRRHNLYLIEDCAQAHGARNNGRHVGTTGIIGTFSMQQGKPMTCGEGGCCITDDDVLADRIYRLRSDSRRLGPRSPMTSELSVAPALAASNRCLSEFGSALLREELRDLPELHQRRADGARLLRAHLNQINGLVAPRFVGEDDDEAFYHLLVLMEERLLIEISPHGVDEVARALTKRLGVWVHPVYEPLDVHPLWSPVQFGFDVELTQERLVHCHALRIQALAFPHRALLAEPEQLVWAAEVCRQTIEEKRGGVT